MEVELFAVEIIVLIFCWFFEPMHVKHPWNTRHATRHSLGMEPIEATSYARDESFFGESATHDRMRIPNSEEIRRISSLNVDFNSAPVCDDWSRTLNKNTDRQKGTSSD